MRVKARRDENERDIIRAYQAVGAHVEVLNMPDLTDLIVLFRKTVTMVEVKNPAASKSKRQLRPGQEAFRVRWTAAGGNHARVETVNEALNAIGLVAR